MRPWKYKPLTEVEWGQKVIPSLNNPNHGLRIPSFGTLYQFYDHNFVIEMKNFNHFIKLKSLIFSSPNISECQIIRLDLF